MPDQNLRFRRKVVQTGEPQPKNRLLLLVSVAAAVIIVPALVYTAMHPAAVTGTVTNIARHIALPVKDIRVAVVAVRSTVAPLPSPKATVSAAATPSTNAELKLAKEAKNAALVKHLEHLKHERALAAARSKRLALSGRTASDIAGSDTNSGLSNSSDLPASQSTPTKAPTSAPQVAATPAQVALAQNQVPVSEATPVYAPEIVVDARFTRQVQPDYPEVAKAQNAQGTAIVLATIGPSGNVLSARIDQSTGNKLLDSAALEAARASGFEPPKINGKPATETYRLVYTFSL